MRTGDNREVIVPNSNIVGGNIINYSAKDTRRIDLVIGVSYEDDLKKVKEELWNILNSDERILKDPPPTIAVSELADSSVNFVVRPWVKSSDYWPVYFDLLETIKTRFDEVGITIPYPQMDVHLYKKEA
jgi:small conductance mechanosensitive channel